MISERVPDLTTIKAYVNHSRWVADCPRCNGAEVVNSLRPVMFCGSCRSGPFSVEFPPNRELIEMELRKRPFEKNRNWHPWETVEELREENSSHGVDSS